MPAFEITGKLLNYSMEELLLINKQSPGDALVMTAAVQSLHAKYPGKYKTACDTSCNAIFEHNPMIQSVGENARKIKMEYPLIHKSNQLPVHFVQGFTDFLGKELGIDLPLATRRPLLFLSKEEQGWVNQVEEATGYKGKFWLVNAGTKPDYTVKGWGHFNYQQVIDALYGRVVFVQVGESHHQHRALKGAINFIGKTDSRQLIRLAYHSQGAITGVSFLHHIMAAFQKPCVTIASGMEPKSWEMYETGTYLSCHGMLPCCRVGACWKSVVEPKEKKAVCVLPIYGEEEVIPKCMAMINPMTVVKAIEDYHFGLGMFTVPEIRKN